MRALILSSLVAAALGITGQQPPEKALRFVFTSDAHYGLRRAHFRGRTNVRAHDVNSALVADIKSLGDLDFVVEGGDVANRAEAGEHVQPASVSWAEFTRDYIKQLKTPVYVVPGNHDASNAIGFYRALSARRTSGRVGIYNPMLAPPKRHGDVPAHHRSGAPFTGRKRCPFGS
jgi:DNA repair exonuclease SbcCD nuclease subunit